jgi:hypothetical protein
VEIYVGQGSKRVRELFSTARREALRRWKQKHGSDRFGFRQCISRAKDLIGIDTCSKSNAMSSSLRQPTAVVFIDEIDALAKCRDGIGGLEGIMKGKKPSTPFCAKWMDSNLLIPIRTSSCYCHCCHQSSINSRSCHFAARSL